MKKTIALFATLAITLSLVAFPVSAGTVKNPDPADSGKVVFDCKAADTSGAFYTYLNTIEISITPDDATMYLVKVFIDGETNSTTPIAYFASSGVKANASAMGLNPDDITVPTDLSSIPITYRLTTSAYKIRIESSAIASFKDITVNSIKVTSTFDSRPVLNWTPPSSDSTPNKTALDAAITTADSKIESNYTSGWAAFQTALTAAKGVSDNEDATQEEIDTALSNLNTAMSALVRVEDDDEVISEPVEYFTAKAKETYPDNFWKIYGVSFGVTAKPQGWFAAYVYVDGNAETEKASRIYATQAGIGASFEGNGVDVEILTGISDPGDKGTITYKSDTPLFLSSDSLAQVRLRARTFANSGSYQINSITWLDKDGNELSDEDLSPDKTALDAAITTANGKKESDYKSGWSAFQTALTEAKAVAAKSDATQAEIDAAITKLNSAMSALVAVDTGSSSGGNSSTGSGSEVPETGNTTPMVVVFATMILAAGTVVLVRKKRLNTNR